MLRWRVYFTDGTTYSSEAYDGNPATFPMKPVAVIRQRREEGDDLMLLCGSDFYFLRRYEDAHSEWYQAPAQSDMNQQLFYNCHYIDIVRAGQTIRDRVYRILLRRATGDKLL